MVKHDIFLGTHIAEGMDAYGRRGLKGCYTDGGLKSFLRAVCLKLTLALYLRLTTRLRISGSCSDGKLAHEILNINMSMNPRVTSMRGRQLSFHWQQPVTFISAARKHNYTYHTVRLNTILEPPLVRYLHRTGNINWRLTVYTLMSGCVDFFPIFLSS